MDKLHIKDLTIFAHHGVFPEEKELGQKFVLDLTLTYDMTTSARTGDLSSSVHYGELSQQVTEWFSQTSYELIETAGYAVMEQIFTHYPVVRGIDLTVKKPWAPVHLPLETCAVQLVRQKSRAFIGLGTNMGDKVNNLALARQHMTEAGLVITQASTLLETEPWGGVEQDSFLNQVVQIETWLTPEALLDTLLEIEHQMGRVRDIKWGPRMIDLDVLFIDNQVIYTDKLIVPHPYVTERDFVLQSLNELAPHYIHPVVKKPMRQLLAELTSV